MRAEIISVGTELLLGDILNTNAQYLAQQLAALGFDVFNQTVVGDNAPRLRSLVLEAKERSDILIFTGGLGPTDDDLTKETVAEVFGDVLVTDPEELAKLEQFFKQRGAVMTLNNRKQAMVPRAGRKLPNANGTAPGAYFRQGGKYAILLPGPPREMQPVFEEQVLPLLEGMQDSSIRSLTLRVFGIGESALEDKLRDLLNAQNPTAALYAKTGEVHIRITAKAPTAEAAELMCDEYADLFRKQLGPLVYSNGDSLEATVVRLLIDRGQTLSTAESCTGGLMGQRLTSVPGASAVYGYGAITYANEAKHEMLKVANGTLRRYGAVSGQVAGEMAFGAARLGRADYGAAITGVAGPDGGTLKKPVGLVYAAVASGREVFVKKLTVNDRGREYVRELATLNTLDMVRRVILGLPIPDAKRFTKSQQADYERQGKPRRRGGVLGRALLAFLLVAVLLVALVGGLWLAGRQGGGGPSSLSAQGLQYGTPEYERAAQALVAQAQQQNPAVVGLVAFAGDRLESLVAQATQNGQSALALAQAEPGIDGLPVMGADALPGRTGGNTVVWGEAAFSALAGLAQGALNETLSTFTYFTAGRAEVYRLFAVYYADEAEQQPDNFDPETLEVEGYQGFLRFAIGAKARSLYDVQLDLAPGDSFMTLAVPDASTPGRTLYLSGRLQRPAETQLAAPFSLVADPLMPAAYYTETGQARPDAGEKVAGWMRWYLNREVENSLLQLQAGMPTQDAAPVLNAEPPLYDQPQTLPASSAPASSSAPSMSAASSESGSSAPSGSGDSDEDGGASVEASGTGSGASAGSEAESSPAGSQSIPQSTPPPASSSRPLPAPAQPAPDPTMLTVTLNGVLTTDKVETILAHICQNEVPNAGPEAVKVVAVAAHSWILNRQGAGDAAPRVTGRPPSVEVLDAVAQVSQKVLSADGVAPAFTPWYGMAAFSTNSPQVVFGGTRPYLEEVASPHEQVADSWRRIISLPYLEVAAMVQRRLGVDLAESGLPEQWFAAIEKTEGGYVQSLTLGQHTVTGVAFWQQVLVANGQPLLQSPAFEVQFDGENFVFISYGAGHGCGLSLFGAQAYAREGWGYERILQHYYPGANLIAWE